MLTFISKPDTWSAGWKLRSHRIFFIFLAVLYDWLGSRSSERCIHQTSGVCSQWNDNEPEIRCSEDGTSSKSASVSSKTFSAQGPFRGAWSGRQPTLHKIYHFSGTHGIFPASRLYRKWQLVSYFVSSLVN
jgi:hypothetical protein